MTTFEQAAATIAAAFAHGHDELTDGCALCIAEYDAVRDALDADCPSYPRLEQQ